MNQTINHIIILRNLCDGSVMIQIYTVGWRWTGRSKRDTVELPTTNRPAIGEGILCILTVGRGEAEVQCLPHRGGLKFKDE